MVALEVLGQARDERPGIHGLAQSTGHLGERLILSTPLSAQLGMEEGHFLDKESANLSTQMDMGPQKVRPLLAPGPPPEALRPPSVHEDDQVLRVAFHELFVGKLALPGSGKEAIAGADLQDHRVAQLRDRTSLQRMATQGHGLPRVSRLRWLGPSQVLDEGRARLQLLQELPKSTDVHPHRMHPPKAPRQPCLGRAPSFVQPSDIPL